MERNVSIAALGAVITLSASFAANAANNELGIALNGVCRAGSCPASGPISSSSEFLPLAGTLTLSDGDVYKTVVDLAESSMPLSGERYIQLTYLGQKVGGALQQVASQADVIGVDLFRAWPATAPVKIGNTINGTFADGIAASSSLTASITDLETGVIVADYGKFDATSRLFNKAVSFQLASYGAIALSKGSYSLAFGAGSLVGASITIGNPAAVPESGTAAMLLLGLASLACKVRRRKSADKSTLEAMPVNHV